ncbi:MAG: hypothetical protein O9262_12645 [Cyclobacteriaceae bacterium]|nr:hypothetical protein [Cyclobacteriaceae bacterium]
MKTTLLTLAAATLLFVSCDNENAVNPQPVGNLTIKGTIYADFDEEEDAGDLAFETAPANVPVFFYNDDTDALLGETTTNASGAYTIELPVGIRSRDIRITVGDFETEINVYDFIEDDYVTKDAFYSDRQNAYVYGAVKGATYIQNIQISQPEVINFD